MKENDNAKDKYFGTNRDVKPRQNQDKYPRTNREWIQHSKTEFIAQVFS